MYVNKKITNITQSYMIYPKASIINTVKKIASAPDAYPDPAGSISG